MAIRHRYVNPIADDPAEAALQKTLPSHWNQTHEGGDWLFASGAPASGVGDNGDFYVNTDTNEVYKKASGSWGTPVATLGSTPLDLEVNGTPNADQSLLNLVAGSNVTITDLGGGSVRIASSGGGGGGGGTVNVTGPVVGNGSAGNPLDVQVGVNEIAYGDGSNGSLISDTGATRTGLAGQTNFDHDDGAGNTSSFRATPTDHDQSFSDGTQNASESKNVSTWTSSIDDGAGSSYSQRLGASSLRRTFNDGTNNTQVSQSAGSFNSETTDGTGNVVTIGSTTTEAKIEVQEPSGLINSFTSDTVNNTMNHHDGVDQTLVRGPTARPSAIGDVWTITANPSTGEYESEWQPIPSISASLDIYYADSFDGAFVLNGTNTYPTVMSLVGTTYTLLRTIYASSFQVDSGITLETLGFAIYVNGTMTVNGTVGSVGNTATASVAPSPSNYGTAGIANTLSSTFTFDQVLIPNPIVGTTAQNSANSGGAGGRGNTGSNGWGLPGQSIVINHFLLGGLGGAGGRGTNGSGFTTGSTVTFQSGFKFLPFSFFRTGVSVHNGNIMSLTTPVGTSGIRVCVGSPGGGGGAGTNISGGWGGVGGTGGSAPYGVIIVAKILTVGASGIIRSNGGNGGAGTPFSLTNSTSGSGGGGAGGGIVYIMTGALNYTPNNQLQARGGTGGASGGFGGGVASSIPSEAGQNGSDGYIHIQNTSTGLSVVYTGQH